MPIESFIEDPQTGQQAVYRRFNVRGSGHLYCSYPDGPGNFTAILVAPTGEDTADVIEIPDGSSIQLGFDFAELPDGATTTQVTAEDPFETTIFSPDGMEANLVVRHAGATALSA